MAQTIAERLTILLKNKRFSVNALSKELGLNQKTLNNQLNGSTSLSADTVCAIIRLFPDVSLDWLMLGEGTMLRSGSEPGADSNNHEEFLLHLLEEEKERSRQYWNTIQKLIGK